MSKQDVIIGNCLDVLKGMQSESIDCVVTSPPYWNLRDYKSEPARYGVWEGQLGLEDTPDLYISHLLMIFDEVKRVLKPTGACWVNIGDTYMSKDICGIRQKSLCQIPSRFAIAMTDRGWILRNEIIWQKSNCMPTSVKDRFTVDFEKFFFFTKSPKYYFKQQFEAMKQPIKTSVFGRQKDGNCNHAYSGRLYDASKLGGVKNVRTTWFFEDTGSNVNTSKWGDDDVESSVRQGMNQNRGSNIVEKRYVLPEKSVFTTFLRSRTKPKDLIDGTDISLTTAEHWFRSDDGFSYPSVEDWAKIRDKLQDSSQIFIDIDAGMTTISYETDDICKNCDGLNRNARTTWTINPQASPLEHCAMFPKALIERPIDACCPPGGVVLDPFCGSGTVLEYCFEHDIEAIGIEINPIYEPIIKKRANYGQKKLLL